MQQQEEITACILRLLELLSPQLAGAVENCPATTAEPEPLPKPTLKPVLKSTPPKPKPVAKAVTKPKSLPKPESIAEPVLEPTSDPEPMEGLARLTSDPKQSIKPTPLPKPVLAVKPSQAPYPAPLPKPVEKPKSVPQSTGEPEIKTKPSPLVRQCLLKIAQELSPQIGDCLEACISNK